MMQPLGRYPLGIAEQYVDLLLDNGIDSRIDDPGPNVRSIFVNGQMGVVTVLVPAEAIIQAEQFIKDYEVKVSKDVKVDANAASRALLWILAIVIVFIGIIALATVWARR